MWKIPSLLLAFDIKVLEIWLSLKYWLNNPKEFIATKPNKIEIKKIFSKHLVYERDRNC